MTKQDISFLAEYRDRMVAAGKWSNEGDVEFDDFQPEVIIQAEHSSRIRESEIDAGITLDMIEAELTSRLSRRMLYRQALHLIQAIREGRSVGGAAKHLGYDYHYAYRILQKLRREDFVHKYR